MAHWKPKCIDCRAWASYQIHNIAGCACAGNAGNLFPATDFKGNCSLAIPTCITARAWRTCRDACRDRQPAVAGKRSRRMRNPQFYVSAIIDYIRRSWDRVNLIRGNRTWKGPGSLICCLILGNLNQGMGTVCWGIRVVCFKFPINIVGTIYNALVGRRT